MRRFLRSIALGGLIAALAVGYLPGVGLPTAAAGEGQLDLHEFAGSTETSLTGLRAHAVAAGDINGDGWTDVFVGTFADRPVEEYATRGANGPGPDRLMLGGPQGFRLDPTFPAMFGRSSGAAFADLDVDGDLDLIILRQPRSKVRADAPSVVLRNTGGRFEVATVLDATRGLRSVGVLDFDGDGLLDLFLVEDRFSGGSSVLLHNNGDLTFADATSAASLPTDIHGLGVVAADLNGDTKVDLFIGGSNRLFLGAGTGFTEAEGPFSWTTFGDEDDVAGVAAGDVDRDGRIDLVLGQHFNSTTDDGRSVPVRLYLNRGNDALGEPIFEDVTVSAGLVEFPTKAPHLELVDLDSDGQLDIVTSASAGNGTKPAVLYQEPGPGLGFSTPEGLGDSQYWVAGATFDADHDGTLDLFFAEWEPSKASPLLTGPSPAGGWLDVQVGATGSAGVGAVVEVFRSGFLGDGTALIAKQPIMASVGYGSGSLSRAHLGLGPLSQVDVRITMPNNGRIVERRNVAANTALTVSIAEAGPPGVIETGPPDVVVGGPDRSPANDNANSAAAVGLTLYPRPQYEGNPWTQWGQGLVLDDGRFVSAIGDHLGADGNSYIFIYDPRTDDLVLAGDVLSAVPHDPGAWGYGKVHGQIVQIDANSVAFATYWGNRRDLVYGGSYQGDYLLKLDTRTLAIDPLGVPLPGRGIPSLDSYNGLIYGEAVEPATDAGEFFVFDPASGEVVHRVTHPAHDRFRGIAVMDDGSAYLATNGSGLLRFDPELGQLAPHQQDLPAGWLRATTDPDQNGTVYGVTRKPERFVAIDATGVVRDLGAAPGYITSLALDGDRVLFVPDAHGDAYKTGAPVMALDVNTREQSVLVELNPLSEDRLGLTLGGTYSLDIDVENSRLFVGLNAGASADSPWGEIVLAVVELDDLGAPVPQFPPGQCRPNTNPLPKPNDVAAKGYWVLQSDGQVHGFGAPHYGDLDGQLLDTGTTAVGLAVTISGDGYWVVDSLGRVHTFGDAVHFGDTAAFELNSPIIAIAAHPSGGGYWLLASDGGVFTFGAALFHGSTGAMALNAPVVSMASTSSGDGYWLLASDGGVFSFGDAQFHGSTGALVLNEPVISMAVNADGSGYWLVASDGGVFSFGVPFVGSIPGLGLCQVPSTIALASTVSGAGYYALLADGGIITFGDAVFRGANPSAITEAVDLDVLR